MARTFKRQPYSVSTDKDDYEQANFFTHAQFKGISDDKNDVIADQLTFADAKNVYIDEANVLTSRPPFKFYDGEGYIVEQWLFGSYGLRLHRILTTTYHTGDYWPYLIAPSDWYPGDAWPTGQDSLGRDYGNPPRGWLQGDVWPYDAPPADGTDYRVNNPSNYAMEDLYFTFIIRCITHSTVSGTYNGSTIYGEYGWKIPVMILGWDFLPKVTCTQVEDKIFIWFAGLDFIDFNTAGVLMSDGNNYPYFESAVKYLYFPIHKLVINGIESDLETKNFLTETYKKRHQYSILSSVNFEKLSGRQVSVNLNGDMTNDTSKYLYETNIGDNQSKMLVYPYSPIGSNYYVDVVQTPRSIVMLRYSAALHTIEISFDGKSYRALPVLENIVGLPLLTKDGLWAVAFTSKGIAKCKLVAQESVDFYSNETAFSWVIDPYMRNVLINGFPGYINELDTSFVPVGHFETIDNYAYVFSGASIYTDISGNIQYLYTEWLSGTNNIMWGHTPLIVTHENTYAPLLPNDGIKVHFRYVTPTTDHKDLGAAITILTQGLNQFTNGTLTRGPDGEITFYFKQDLDNVNRSLQNDDRLFLTEILGNSRSGNQSGWAGYVHRLSADGTTLVDDAAALQPTDVISFTSVPLNVSPTDDYSSTYEYHKGDTVSRNTTINNVAGTYVFSCLQTSVGHDVTDTDYWSLLTLTLTSGGTTTTIAVTSRPTMFSNRNDGRFPTNFTRNNEARYIDITWKMFYLLYISNSRYMWEHTDNIGGVAYPNDRIRLTNRNLDTTYTVDVLTSVFGTIPTVYDTNGNVDTDVTNWPLPWTIGKPSPQNIYTGNAIILGLGNTALVDRSQYINLGINVRVTNEDNTTSLYVSQGFGFSCSQMDINMMAPLIDAEQIKYECVAAYSIKGSRAYSATAAYIVGDIVISSGTLYKCIRAGTGHAVSDTRYWQSITGEADNEVMLFDCFNKVVYEYIEDEYDTEAGTMQLVLGNSHWFKIMSNTDTVLTDRYLWVDDAVVGLPQNGMLAPIVDDAERNVMSDDEVLIALRENADDDIMYYDRNVHKLTADGTELAAGPIQSGDLVSYTPDAISEQDYLQPGAFGGTTEVPTGSRSNRFIIERLGIDEDGNWVAVSGYIKTGDLIRFRAYGSNITLPVGNPGNPFNANLVISPYNYPAAPSGWTLGDDWPSNWPTYPPIYANANGTIRFWSPRVVDEWGWEIYPGDPLPTGPILLYGATNIVKRVRPLTLDGNGVWYSIDGALWTSQLSSENILELDEYINAEIRNVVDTEGNVVGRTRLVDMRSDVPDYFAALNEYYYSFTTRQEGHNVLEITATRRDDNKLFSDKGTDLLLYLPELNEQKFANKITNLHPLAENIMGVFTDSEIWYVQTVTLNDSTIAYTKPTKSKIPVGCKAGNSVITALDGQALIFPTARGLAAMAPEAFVATTENTLTYLSDAIQDKYHKFYNNIVMSAALMPEDFSMGYRPMIKIVVYKYWLLLYRYMDREILALDTRSGTWWSWETPYPIKSLMVGARLHALLQIDFTPMTQWGIQFPVDPASLLGVSFVWTDKEVKLVIDDTTMFPSLGDTPIANIGYYDDVVAKTLNGISRLVYENKFVGDRRVVEYATPIIKWHFISQKLHFNAINNYKGIYQINTNLIGTDSIIAKLSTKVYRDGYHPEKADTMEIRINDLKTFVKRLNLMHVINFQYRFEGDETIDKALQKQLMLNSICIKYGIKEGVR